MKQSSAILLTLLLLSACSAPAPDNQQQLQFYYCTVDSGFDADSSAIRAESRECNSLTNVEEILTVYLAGPQSADLCSPFPAALISGSTMKKSTRCWSVLDGNIRTVLSSPQRDSAPIPTICILARRHFRSLVYAITRLFAALIVGAKRKPMSMR